MRAERLEVMGIVTALGTFGYDFFFSSRRRHTRYWRDWSSDVCSSDLERLNVKFCDRDVSDGEDPEVADLETYIDLETRYEGFSQAGSEEGDLSVLTHEHEIGRASCRERV